jgi:hypothetical protein
MGKYTKVMENLPVIYATDPARHEKIKEAQRHIAADPGFKFQGGSIGFKYTQLRATKDILQKAAKNVGFRIDALVQMADEQFINEGINSIKLDAGVNYPAALEMAHAELDAIPAGSIKMPLEPTVRLQPEPYAKMVDLDKNREWAIANGLERSLRLPWPKLNMLLKGALLEGDPYPDGVDAYKKQKLVLVKG